MKMPLKTKKKMIQRSEASESISEFNLTEVGKEKVKLDDLLKTLKKTTGHQTLKQQLKHAEREKKLDIPLSKPVADRIKRSIAYGKVSKDVKKWDNIVRANRSAEQIVYPLKKPEFRIEAAEDFVQRFQTKNAFEEEVSKLLSTSENVLDQKKELTVAEEKALQAMSLAEAKARHGELRKMRALLSYKEAKAKRQKKIKSKKYHRVLKKEKMKKLMKEFETLQQIDPESAKEKLQEADKLRILERMTLKHKSTGKWAKQQKIRAKYNVDSRSALKEQMVLGKQLTDKVIPVDDLPEISQDLDENPEDEEVEDGDLLNLYKLSSDTPLIIPQKAVKVTKTVIKRKVKRNLDIPEIEDNEIGLIDESCERLQTLEDCDAINDNTVVVSLETDNAFTRSKFPVAVEKPKPQKDGNYVAEVDLISDAEILNSMVPNDITLGDEGIDDEEDEDRMNISQAFADEDFISEFKEDKSAAVKRDQPEGINLYLPGWGSWGGSGIKASRKKRRRFYIKPINIPERKDSTLGNVIINEDKDAKAAVHQVNELPFQFKTVDQFESIIRQPVGNTWNTETSFQKLIAPKVVTKMGKIIDPIDAEDVTLDKKPEGRKTFKKRAQKSKQHKGKTRSKRKSKAK